MSIVEIADRLEVHPNTVRFHLDRLTAAGLVESVDAVGTGPAAPGRPALRFRARAAMDPDGPRGYRFLAELLVESLQHGEHARERSLAAGRSWGRRRSLAAQGRVVDGDPLGVLVETLAELGFAPALRTQDGEEQITLGHCPFLELANTHRDVICPVHLGLMRGVLEQADQGLNAPITVQSLEPFVEPDRCLARLGATTS